MNECQKELGEGETLLYVGDKIKNSESNGAHNFLNNKKKTIRNRKCNKSSIKKIKRKSEQNTDLDILVNPKIINDNNNLNCNDENFHINSNNNKKFTNLINGISNITTWDVFLDENISRKQNLNFERFYDTENNYKEKKSNIFEPIRIDPDLELFRDKVTLETKLNLESENNDLANGLLFNQGNKLIENEFPIDFENTNDNLDNNFFESKNKSDQVSFENSINFTDSLYFSNNFDIDSGLDLKDNKIFKCEYGRQTESNKKKKNQKSISNCNEVDYKFDKYTTIEFLIEKASSYTYDWYKNLFNFSSKGQRTFSQEEINAVVFFVSGYCYINKITRQDICNRIWSNERKKDNFWEALTKVLPYRSRASVYKHIRRQYHIFDVRAKWSAQDDQLLSKLVLTREGKWKEIGEIMNRMPEDCRDRWRNYIKCGENRILNKWSEEEENLLKNVVSDMIILSKNQKNNNLINWTIVSEKMNGVRSRIQCRYKWKKLMKKESMNKLTFMNLKTKIWLLESLKKINSIINHNFDWKYISDLFEKEKKEIHEPNANWNAFDFENVFEKMKSEFKDYKQLPIANLIEKMLQDLHFKFKIIKNRNTHLIGNQSQSNFYNNISLLLPEKKKNKDSSFNFQPTNYELKTQKDFCCKER